MKVVFIVNHPAHYHLCKTILANLKKHGHNTIVLARDKDVLVNLLEGENYHLIPIKKGKNFKEKLLKYNAAKQYMLDFVQEEQPDLVIGSGDFCTVASKLHIPAILLNEDDVTINFMIFLAGLLHYNKYTDILAPICCENSFWNKKTIKYPSYHELAYLHPNHFTPNKEVASKYIDLTRPFFILRFAQLNAYHDLGIKGINTEVAQRLISILKPHGQIYITSERPLEPEFEPYRIRINPLDMHHVMAFASLYIGDSQTMAAEAGVLGIPFVRFNDFVGKIGYLEELENIYNLGVGIKASEEGSVERLCRTVENLVGGLTSGLSPDGERKSIKKIYQERRAKMLADKIDYAKFLTWFIENYPASKEQTKTEDGAFWQQFK